jgi:hypothetical protein
MLAAYRNANLARGASCSVLLSIVAAIHRVKHGAHESRR